MRCAAPWCAARARSRRWIPAAAPPTPASSRAFCPVAELGAVGSTMHKVDEAAPVAELRDLAALYRMVLEEAFA